MNLAQSRESIDRIDDQIATLFAKRLDLMGDIAATKKAQGMAVRQKEREHELLARITANRSPVHKDALTTLYQVIFDLCATRQDELLSTGTYLRQLLATARWEDVGQGAATVACQGVEGAYSHIAAASVFPQGVFAFSPRFEDVFCSVAQGKAQFGVLPLENSTAGSVHEVYDLMSRHNFCIAKAVKLPIHHCLLACAGTKAEDVQTVFSHPQALSQCSHFLQASHVQAQATANTAMAAQMVAEKQQTNCAAIASVRTAELYGLEILQTNIQNANQNTTRFIIISKEFVLSPKATHISISLTLPHEAGALYRLLTRFAVLGLNLTKLESRPLPNTDFDFLFYFDIEGHIQDPHVAQLLEHLHNTCTQFTLLGNYPQIRMPDASGCRMPPDGYAAHPKLCR